MPYPGTFHRLVAIGSLYTDETFNFSMSIVNEGLGAMVPVTETFANTVASVVESWFNDPLGATGVGITSSARLTSVKLNRIDASGHYADPESIEIVVPGGTAGGSAAFPPPQTAVAVTLATVMPRGRGSKGRFYLPPLGTNGTVGATDGRMTTTTAGQIATGAAALVNGINAAYFTEFGTGDFLCRVGVASDAGAGVFRYATEVRVGRVIDTIRSRRSSLSEAPSTVVLA